MTTLREKQLDWIQRNRRRTARARSVGGLMARLAERLGDKAWAGVRDTATSLIEFVDDDFREHCRLTLAADGRLTINVDHAGLVYAMRAQWLPLVTRVVVAGNPGRGVRSITFSYGLDGVAVGKPAAEVPRYLSC